MRTKILQFHFHPSCNSGPVTICGGQKCGSSFGCVNAPRWRPTSIPHKHVNGRERYMAAVCYTCYRPARTGYVRQSIALILALGAALCIPVVVCDAGRIPFQPLDPSARLLTLVADPLHRSSQELHHQVITSTSSHVYSRWCQRRRIPMQSPRPRSFPKPLRPVTAHHRGAEFSKKFARLMFRRSASPRTSISPSVISVFGPSRRYPHRLSYIVEQYPASFGLLPEKL